MHDIQIHMSKREVRWSRGYPEGYCSQRYKSTSWQKAKLKDKYSVLADRLHLLDCHCLQATMKEPLLRCVARNSIALLPNRK